MSFQDAVRTCFQKYVTFSGRARRSEFWYFVLFNVIVGFVAGIIDVIIGTRSSYGTGLIQSLASLALLLPNLAVGARRLHDTDRSGWWLLIGLIPLVGAIVLIVFFVQDSHADNQHGPSPKGVGGAAYQEMPPPAPQY